jgi:hypothetical protein
MWKSGEIVLGKTGPLKAFFKGKMNGRKDKTLRGIDA